MKKILLFFATTSLLTGCGSSGFDYVIESDAPSASLAQGDASGCAPFDQPNIVPIHDTLSDGSRHYRTCFNEVSPSTVRIIGHSSQNAWVCAFPIVATSLTSFQPIRDRNGLPVSQCWDARAAGTTGQTLNFYFSGFDALAIVDYPQRLEMSRCLASGQTCPNDFAVGSL